MKKAGAGTQKNRWKKRYLVLLFLLAVMLSALYYFVVRTAGGCIVYPETEIPLPENTVFFFQKDAEWGNDHLGTAKDTMASSGCLVSALAAGLDMQAARQGIPFSMTAGELNHVFSEKNVYTEHGAVIWGQVGQAVSGAECQVPDEVSSGLLDQWLKMGYFPVAKVRVKGTGAYHWVLIIGAEGGRYVCMDPLKERETPVSLDEFKNRIYAIRAVHFREYPGNFEGGNENYDKKGSASRCHDGI